MLHAATVLQTWRGEARRLTCNILIYATCGAVIDWPWQMPASSSLSGTAPSPPPPIALLDRNLWAQHVQKAEQSFSRRAWFVVTKVFHRFSLATHTHFSRLIFRGGNPFNVAVKTSEEKLFRIVWTIKKQHKIIKKENSLWKKENQNCCINCARAGQRQGVGAQPISLYVC